MADSDARIERNEKDIKSLWDAVDEIKQMMIYRLPLWATALIALLTGACGFLLRMVIAVEH